MKRSCLLTLALFIACLLTAQERKGKVNTPPPNKPPLIPADLSKPPAGTDGIDLYLLMGQSNMKGRGFMPEVPANDPRIIMMHLKDDQWYVARHPLHLTGEAKTFAGADNAGVGAGLAFAQSVAAADSTARIGLIPCAVGGTSIKRWQKGADLYENAIRRAKLALEQTQAAGGSIKGILWLQGEADSKPGSIEQYPAQLNALVDALRADLALPALPFIAATIIEPNTERAADVRKNMNAILLNLPKQRPSTDCVDARDIMTTIGDNVHYDTAAQEEIGRRFAAKFLELTKAR